MSYPRTPNNDGEYTEPDGRIRISRERHERLAVRARKAAATSHPVENALDSEFVTPGPRVSLSQEALDALAQLLVEAAAGKLLIQSADSPIAAARSRLMNRLEVTTDG